MVSLSIKIAPLIAISLTTGCKFKEQAENLTTDSVIKQIDTACTGSLNACFEKKAKILIEGTKTQALLEKTEQEKLGALNLEGSGLLKNMCFTGRDIFNSFDLDFITSKTLQLNTSISSQNAAIEETHNKIYSFSDGKVFSQDTNYKSILVSLGLAKNLSGHNAGIQYSTGILLRKRSTNATKFWQPQNEQSMKYAASFRVNTSLIPILAEAFAIPSGGISIPVSAFLKLFLDIKAGAEIFTMLGEESGWDKKYYEMPETDPLKKELKDDPKLVEFLTKETTTKIQAMDLFSLSQDTVKKIVNKIQGNPNPNENTVEANIGIAAFVSGELRTQVNLKTITKAASSSLPLNYDFGFRRFAKPENNSPEAQNLSIGALTWDVAASGKPFLALSLLAYGELFNTIKTNAGINCSSL